MLTINLSSCSAAHAFIISTCTAFFFLQESKAAEVSRFANLSICQLWLQCFCWCENSGYHCFSKTGSVLELTALSVRCGLPPFAFLLFIFSLCVLSCSVVSDSLTLCKAMDCRLPSSSVHGDSPGQNTGVGSLSLLQAIFPSQGSNPGLPH